MTMRVLSAGELLAAWERGLTQPPVQRTLTLLSAAYPDTPTDALAGLSIGQRDDRLMTLREWTFGSQLVSVATCAGCGERLELTFDVGEIRAESPREEEGSEGNATLSLSTAGYEVHFRLPNSLDLAAVTGHPDAATTRRRLLARCLVRARRKGQTATVDQLPAQVVEAVVEHMAQADPQADVQLALCCPTCDHRWQAAFDIASFFWSEISAWAYRTLHEVHVLARAYGWREADILAMSPWRRGFYLELAA